MLATPASTQGFRCKQELRGRSLFARLVQELRDDYESEGGGVDFGVEPFRTIE